MHKLDIVLTGDSLITRPFGDFHATGYDELTELLRAADAGLHQPGDGSASPGAPGVASIRRLPGRRERSGRIVPLLPPCSTTCARWG